MFKDDFRSPIFYNLSSHDVKYDGTSRKPRSFKVAGDPARKLPSRKYIIGEALGRGSYAKVKRCVRLDTNEVFALKMYKINRMTDDIARQREESLRREIKVMERLDHPNIIRIYETVAVEKGDRLFIVLELADAGSVGDAIQRYGYAGVPPQVTRRLFRQLIDGLKYLHGLGIVHRDIKPDNLLISEDNILKISDFGSAVDVGVGEPLTTGANALVSGSMAFMPPEVIKNEVIEDPFRIDAWQAGVVLYCLVTGRFPFEGRDIYAIMDKIRRCDNDFPFIADPFLSRLLHGLLRPDPKRRFTIDDADRCLWLQETPAAEWFKIFGTGVWRTVTALPVTLIRSWRREQTRSSSNLVALDTECKEAPRDLSEGD